MQPRLLPAHDARPEGGQMEVHARGSGQCSALGRLVVPVMHSRATPGDEGGKGGADRRAPAMTKLSGAPLPPTPPPPAFMPPVEACLYFGASKTRLYDHFAKLDPGILVQVGGRTLVDVERLKALISGMPRGPRKQLAPDRNRKGRKRRT